MRASRAPRAWLAAGAIVLLAAPAARADDEAAERTWDELSGEIRAGWRFLRHEEDGRFFQDHSLQDGPRIFDLGLLGSTQRADAKVSSFEATAHGIGDEESDYRLRLARDGLWTLEGGYSRDDFSYRATGDPFPYDTRRERSDLRFRWTPSSKLTFRVDWDKSLRRGDAYLAGQTTIRGQPDPPLETDEIVQDHRPLHQRADRVTVGVDASFEGGFRFSLAESVRLLQIDDTRVYHIPREDSGLTPVFEALRREVRSPAWTTIAKAGWTSPDRALDVEAIFSYTIEPTDSRVAGTAQGHDGAFDAGLPKGEFLETKDGSNSVDRDAIDARVEASWRPAPKWELTAALARESIVDDASLRLTTTRTYTRTVPAPVEPSVVETRTDARITDRLNRASLEAEYEIRDDLRLRVGEEWLEEDLKSPTDSRGHPDPDVPTNMSSVSWRTTVGADWEAHERLDLSLLLRRGTNDDPHAATSFDTSDETVFRGRWRPSDELAVTSVWRHKGYRQDADYDSTSRSDSVSLGATWTHEGLSVAPNVTYQFMDTRTSTSILDTRIDEDPVGHDVSFETRDLIASLDVRYDFSKSLRAFLTTSCARANGDYEAVWTDVSLGAELDLRENLSVGAALKTWCLDESSREVDDYSVVGAEVWVTLRF